MSCRAVLYQLKPAELEKLQGLKGNDGALLRYFQYTLEEEKWQAEDLSEFLELDKTWDAMHHCLAALGKSDDHPARLAVVGGDPLYSGDDYLMTLKSVAQVRAIAEFLRGVTPAMIGERYDRLGPEYEYGQDPEDREATMEFYEGLPAFYAEAARHGWAVLFTVDQ